MTKEGDVHKDGAPGTHPFVLLSRTDRGHQRRGAIVLAAVVAFTAVAPMAPGLVAGEGLRVLSVAALFPWAFNFWLFGWARMVAATAQLHAFPTGRPVVDAVGEERLGQGVLWSHGCLDGTAHLRVAHQDHRPTAQAWIVPNNGERCDLDAMAAYAWAHALSDGNLLSLTGCHLTATVFSDTPPTAHHSISCQQAFHAAQRTAAADLVPPDGWHTLLSRWLPGRMPA
jgi:hypothetical protein